MHFVTVTTKVLQGWPTCGPTGAKWDTIGCDNYKHVNRQLVIHTFPS